MQLLVLFVHVDLFFIKRAPDVLEKNIQIYNDTQYNFYETIPDIVLIQKTLFYDLYCNFSALSYNTSDSVVCSWLVNDASRPKQWPKSKYFPLCDVQ
jgi:hypothetical protein